MKHSEGQIVDSVETIVTIVTSYQQLTQSLILSRACGLETVNIFRVDFCLNNFFHPG